MSSKYPNGLDLFQVKVDATSQDDPNGNYVMAEDINDLQDAISTIQKTLGITPQGNSTDVADRLTKVEHIAPLRVPPILVYFGATLSVNGSTSADEAVAYYLAYDHVVLNLDSNTQTIIQKVKAIRSVKFYGYLDCGINTANLSISQIGINVQSLVDAGFDGVYCDNFGWDRGNTRDRQNQILDAIHQHNIPAFLAAPNPDDVFSSGYNLTSNPNWTAPNIVAGDIYHYTNFAVNTLVSTPYLDLSVISTTMTKLYGYRNQYGVKVFTTATIGSSITQSDAQSYFEYAHAVAVLFSVDGFYVVDESLGKVSLAAKSYNFIPFIGSWYDTNPVIKTDVHTCSRITSFGEVVVDFVSHTFEYQGVMIPSDYIEFKLNSLDGSKLLNGSVPDIKISSYDGSRLITAINSATGTEKIDLSKIMEIAVDASQVTGDLPSGLMQANVVQAINAYIGSAKISSAVIDVLDASKITTGTLDAARISSSVISAINAYVGTATIGSAKIEDLDASKITTGDLAADRIQSTVINAINASISTAVIDQAKIGDLSADKITAGNVSSDRMRANVVNAINLYASTITASDAKIDSAVVGQMTVDHLTSSVIQAVNESVENATISAAKIGQLNVDNMKATVISAINATIEAATIDAAHIGALTVDNIKSSVIEAINASVEYATIDAAKIGVLTANNIGANIITSDKIAAGTIDSQHISTGGLDAQIVNVYNSQTGQTLIGSGYLMVDGLDVGVVQSDNLVMNGLFIIASSGYGIMRDNPAGEVLIGSNSSIPSGHQVWKLSTVDGTKQATIDVAGKKPIGFAIDMTGTYGYVTVQGDNTVVQIDLANNVPTGKSLPAGIGPAVIKFVGQKLEDDKHLFVMNTDPDDMNIPDALMVIDAPPGSINEALYTHHFIPLGNGPYDYVLDTNDQLWISMADDGHIIQVDVSNLNSMYWKVVGRIPISAYGTDNYHGGLPGQFGLNMAVGGSSAESYETSSMGDMSGMGGMDMGHGGYGQAGGDLKTYRPHGIEQSSDSDTLYIADNQNNQLIILDKWGNAPYNEMSGTREQANLGAYGMPWPGVPAFTSQTRDYNDTIGQTHYVRYRIDLGGSPEFVKLFNGKIFVTLQGSGQVAIIDEAQITNQIASDKADLVPFTPFMQFPTIPNWTIRYVDVGSKPLDMVIDEANNKLYVTVNGQNQVVCIDTNTEAILSRWSTGPNPRGLDLSSDGTSLYVVNHGGAGSLTFVYPQGPFIGDAYIGLEGMVNYHGAMGWMPNRSDWVYDANGDAKSWTTVEFRINEPMLNEGGYVRMNAQGVDNQWVKIEQDIDLVANWSDGSSPAGTWFRPHNGSVEVAMPNGSSTNFNVQFEIDEFVPKFVSFDNQQTSSFTPTQDGINEEYTGLEYSLITNRAMNGTITSSATPTSGDLNHVISAMMDDAVYTTLPSGLQSVTVDLGKEYMIGMINVCHLCNSTRTYHNTKTEVSADGTNWITVFDSAVSGEYAENNPPTVDNMSGMNMGSSDPIHMIMFDARPVRYIRDWTNGWTDNTASPVTTGTDNTWCHIDVYGDWEIEMGYTYPTNSEKAGQPLATNGSCFVSTDVPGAYIAVDVATEFTTWAWMTFIAGPQYGTLEIDMPTLMDSTHFVAQDWPYMTNVAHKHIMSFPPSLNIKADSMSNIKAGKHRLVIKQSTGRVTLDRMRFEDFQYNTKSSTLIPSSASSNFKRYKIVATQSQTYVGQGLQSTEGAYDDVRKNPDTGQPDGSVQLKYRMRVKAELNPIGGIEERGIAYVTSAIMETGKLSTHWRMSQAADVFPGTRIETWDPSQPHSTGIQNAHLSNGAVSGNKIMPNTIMAHHISPYAKIPEFKLDLGWATHGHGKWVDNPNPSTGFKQVFQSNKDTLDEITGWGTSGTSTDMARSDHDHQGTYLRLSGGDTITGNVTISNATDGSNNTSSPAVFYMKNYMSEQGGPLFVANWYMANSWGIGTYDYATSSIKIGAVNPTTLNTWVASQPAMDLYVGDQKVYHTGNLDITSYYTKSEVDQKVSSSGGDVSSSASNVFTAQNTFTYNAGPAIKIQPASAPATNTTMFQLADNTGLSLVTMDSSGDVVIKGSLTVQGTTTYSSTQTVNGDYDISGNLIVGGSTTLGDSTTDLTTAKGNLRVEGSLIQVGKYIEVARFPVFGVAGDLQFQTDSTSGYDVICADYSTFDTTGTYSNVIPAVPTGATRYYQLMVSYSNNSVGNSTTLQVVQYGTSTAITTWILPNVAGSLAGITRRRLSPYFQTTYSGHTTFQAQDGNGGGSVITNITVIAYDYYV